MRKKGFTLARILTAVLSVGMVAAIAILFIQLKSAKEVTATEESYDWAYPFPPAEEFGESDHYSMIWIGKSSWIKKRFLLVKPKAVHRDYGRLPYLLKAVSDVERKGYIIVSREFLSTDRFLADPGHIDSLLLEVRPPENTEER